MGRNITKLLALLCILCPFMHVVHSSKQGSFCQNKCWYYHTITAIALVCFPDGSVLHALPHPVITAELKYVLLLVATVIKEGRLSQM